MTTKQPPAQKHLKKTEKDFENSLEYWRDLAKMLREELSKERASKPTLVLPERKDTQACWLDRSEELTSDELHMANLGFNECLDEITRLNAPTVCEENK